MPSLGAADNNTELATKSSAEQPAKRTEDCHTSHRKRIRLTYTATDKVCDSSRNCNNSHSHETLNSFMPAPQEMQTRGTPCRHLQPWMSHPCELYATMDDTHLLTPTRLRQALNTKGFHQGLKLIANGSYRRFVAALSATAQQPGERKDCSHSRSIRNPEPDKC